MSVDDARVAELKAKALERENHIKESWVKAMELRLVRDELGKCHKAEGVNHYENCRWLSEKYLAMLRFNRVTGYKTIDV
ncbi:NADH-ubiquinone oxidoreductase 12 kDa subunit [Pholiota conissans]|uniref:NADH-ubiquinone oxidoreductase 12 kDa subunit n=1 Tax=Pholiota conissans TaxID=109636 RepID=A0A9P6D665_9AGAR|nr:NADH-ubiquinone oxidoreductase 12 kDa subunit [Pholiota conissans]